MHCKSCNADLGEAEGRVAFICAEVMGDEYIESYWYCDACEMYMKGNLRDPFHGEIKESGGGQLSKEKGDRLIDLISKCPDPSDERCRCPAHQEMRGGW